MKRRSFIDIAMTLLSVILMGGTMLFPNDLVHQILGIVLLFLWAFHVALNQKWFTSLFRGKYTPFRIMQIVVNIGVLFCAAMLMISGLLMASFVPSEIVGDALGFARVSHLVFSHWYYLFMSFHIGLHLNMMMSKMRLNGIAPKVIIALVSVYGAYAFIVRGVAKYLFLAQQFFFFDFERGYLLFVLDYISILFLFATISHLASKLIFRRKQ